MARLNQERQNELEPVRTDYVIFCLKQVGIEAKAGDKKKVTFEWKGNTITVFPYSGWFSGKGVTAGRGLANLLKQIT